MKSVVRRFLAVFNINNINSMNQPINNLEISKYISVIESALLRNILIEDCAVVSKKSENGQFQLIAYIVSSVRISPEQIQSQLQNNLPTSLFPILPKTYVPVSSIPLTATGQIDEVALMKLAVIDSHLIANVEKQLESMGEIDHVAVIVEPQINKIPALHLTDLLPETSVINAEDHQTHEQKTLSSNNREHQQLLEPKKLAISHGEPLDYPQDAPQTLGELLEKTAQKSTNNISNNIIYIQSDGSEKIQSYQDLWQQAQRILTGLRKLGLKPQDKIIFQLSQNFDIIPAFWGCLLGGFVPVIIAPLQNYEEKNQAVDKICYVWQLLDNPFILTNEYLQKNLNSLSQWLPNPELNPELKICIIEELRINTPDLNYHPSQPDDIAFFNLTSGSTGMPKCIGLTHKNLISRARGANILCNFSSSDVILNWLPFDHIGSISDWHIRCIDIGCQLVYVQTEYILSRPLNWLDLIDKFRITHSWSPNFAYGLINHALKQEQRQNWNLECIKFFLTAGEAVSDKATMEFIEHLHAKYKLPKTALRPAFGMAEMGSGITYYQPTIEHPLTFHTIDKSSLKGQLKRLEIGNHQGTTFTDLGTVIPGVSIRIVDRENSLLLEETIGKLQVRGDVVFKGYHKNFPANKEALLESGWFDTGDLGFISHGHLVITGRAKETIIINGVNYYCHEIETAVEEVKGIEISYTAACAVRLNDNNTDRLAIFFHTERVDDALFNLLKEIRNQVVKQVGINPDYLIPVAKEIIPKTAIGKIQRSQLSQRFHGGEFQKIIKQVDILFGNSHTIPDWFYRQVWQQKSPIINYDTLNITNSTLVFTDNSGLGEYISHRLSEYNLLYITVSSGEDFLKINNLSYQIDPEKAEHYQLLLNSLADNKIILGQIIHLWTYEQYSGEVTSLEAIKQAQTPGIYSLLFLVQALAKVQISQHQVDHQIKLLFVSSYVQSILSTDLIAYEKSPVLGLLKTIPQELPWLNCRHIDLTFEEVEKNGDYLFQELQISSKEREVGYRNGGRFVTRLQKVELLNEPKQPIPFQPGGTYLLSGGLGGIGVEIAKYLLKNYQARLLLIGRTALPEKSTWDLHLQKTDPICQRLQAYQELEQLGGEITYESADICDLKHLQSIVDKSEANWGKKLDGIIHLAGILYEQLVLEESPEKLLAMLTPKMLGTWTLHKLIKNHSHSFFINFSSSNGFFGSTALGAYAAANSFIDRFSQYQQFHSTLNSYCFAWSMWNDTGMSQGYEIQNLMNTKGFSAMSCSQAIASMFASLHHNQTQLFVGLDGNSLNIRRWLMTSENLQTLTAYFTTNSTDIKLHNWQINDSFGTSCTCKLVQLLEMPLTTNGAIDKDKLIRQYIRQETSDYIAPRNEVEQKIAQIWQQVLNISLLSVEDNFFELGGNSLLAGQVISRLRDTFAIELSLQSLFASPSVATLAHKLDILHWAVTSANNTINTLEEYEEVCL
jgi:acyl-CoA synthetase (AMP-forming)/AMP-acid ligase II/short-subunit dehydrogenase/acyl carrier protein